MILFEIACRALDHRPQRGATEGAEEPFGAGAGSEPGGSGVGHEAGSESEAGSELEAKFSARSGARRDSGRAPYQIAITRCDCCKQVTLEAAGRSHPVSPAFAKMVECDAQFLGDVGAAPGKLTRAEQSIPPMIYRAVMRRDLKRCAVPGCRNHCFVEVHHVDPRADGGTHHPERLIVLCGAHHLACHDGLLLIDGRASTGFRFRHADGTPYGKMPNATAQEIARQVLDALTKLGFRRGQAEALLRQGQQKLAEQRVAGAEGKLGSSDGKLRSSDGKLTRSESKLGDADARAREALLRAALAVAQTSERKSRLLV